MSRPRGPVRDFVTGAGCALLIVAVLLLHRRQAFILLTDLLKGSKIKK